MTTLVSQQKLTAAMAAVAILLGAVDARPAFHECGAAGLVKECCHGCPRTQEAAPRTCCSGPSATHETSARACQCSHSRQPPVPERDRPQVKNASLSAFVTAGRLQAPKLRDSRGVQRDAARGGGRVSLAILHCTWLT